MLSIVIPAYQEESRIGKTLEKISSFVTQLSEPVEVIVVDDGSSDNTSIVASTFPNVKILKNTINSGKGFSVKRGMLEAKGDTILFTDADLSTPIEEYTRLRPYIKTYDVVIGSRAMKGAILVPPQSFSRRTLGKGFALIREIVLHLGVQDSQCGFKIFNRKTAREIFEKSCISGFGFDVEILFLSRIYGHSIIEVPITWKNSTESKVSPFKDMWKMLLEIIYIKWNAHTRKYK